MAKVIQAFRELNPDGDKIFKFSGQPLPNPKFGQDNHQKIFRFGALQELTRTLNVSQDCAGKILRYLTSQLPPRLEFRFPLSFLFHSSSDLERRNPHMNLKLTYLPMQINGKIWALLYFHFMVMVEAPMLRKILHPPKTGFQLQS